MAFSEAMAQWAEREICKRYERQFGYSLPLKEPRTLRQKLFARMVLLHRHRTLQYTRLADKLEVRRYVERSIGSGYLSAVTWAGGNPDQAPLEACCDGGWIAKTNHGCGGHRLITPGDQGALRKYLHQQLGENYYWLALEAQYYRIKPQVFIEKLVQGAEDNIPLSYRFWCFSGITKLIQVDDGSAFNPFYSPKWEPLNLSYRGGQQARYQCTEPSNLGKLIRLAETLAAPFGFVRVDLYSLADKVTFSELTFTPLAGDLWFQPVSWDQELGNCWPNDALV